MIFDLDGTPVTPDNVILLSTEQMDSVLPRTSGAPSSLMFYPTAWKFATPTQAIQYLTTLVGDLLPKLYGTGWPAAAAVLSTAVLPFIKMTLAEHNAVNVPVIHIYGGPGEGKTTFLELICAMVGRPDTCIMQGKTCCVHDLPFVSVILAISKLGTL